MNRGLNFVVVDFAIDHLRKQVQLLRTTPSQATKDSFHFEGQNKHHSKDITFTLQDNTKYFKNACQLFMNLCA